MLGSKKLLIALCIAVMLLAFVADNEVSASPAPVPVPAPAPIPCGGCKGKKEKHSCGKKKPKKGGFKKKSC